VKPGEVAETKGKGKVRGKGGDAVLTRAPKGPNPPPRFCNLCKIFGHSDLTCHLQGNAPTPGPSNFRKPFKHVHQRTPRRGLGATRGELELAQSLSMVLVEIGAVGPNRRRWCGKTSFPSVVVVPPASQLGRVPGRSASFLDGGPLSGASELPK